MDSIPRCILLAALVIGGGIFSGAETAFSYCNRTRLKTLAGEGNKSAARVTGIMNSYDKTIVTLLVVINIIHVTAASVSTVLCIDLFGPQSGSVISTIALTLIVFLFSEAIPKNIAKANSDSYAMGVSWLILALSVVLTPVSAVFTFMGDGLKKLFRRGEKAPSMTEDEFSEVIENVEEEGVLQPEESRIIRSAIEFGDLRAHDVMTAREDIIAVNANDDPQKVRDVLLGCKYSRVPVCGTEEAPDGHYTAAVSGIDNIIGILHSNDCLEDYITGGGLQIEKFMLPVYRVPPDMKLNPLFEGMTRRRMHLAVVTGVGGITLGVVTMEDILREIVGESLDGDDDPDAPERKAAVV